MGYHFVIFGLSGIALVAGVVYRIAAIVANHSCREIFEKREVQCSILGVGCVLVIAKVFHVYVHIHHWFIGFLLTLTTAGWEGKTAFFARTFAFGLYQHGAAA